MITLIALLLLSIVFFICAKKTYNDFWEFCSFLLGCFFTIWVIGHSISYFTKSYSFNKFIVKRESFVNSLEESRKNGRELESATILKEISDFNQQLASDKYDNKIWFFDQYIDDRIETVEPIK